MCIRICFGQGGSNRFLFLGSDGLIAGQADNKHFFIFGHIGLQLAVGVSPHRLFHNFFGLFSVDGGCIGIFEDGASLKLDIKLNTIYKGGSNSK